MADYKRQGGARLLTKRIISAVVFVALLIGLSWLGGIPWLLAVMFFVLLCLREYSRLGQHNDLAEPSVTIYILALFLPFLAFWNPQLLGGGVCLTIFVLGILAFMRQKKFADFVFQFFGIIYIGFSLCHLILLRQIDVWLLWFFFLIPWITDTFAYAIGSLFGKHKMIPEISPKKSWEGAIGGAVACVLVLLLYNFWVLHLSTFSVVCIALVCSAFGQAGDILESWLKRWAGVKDSGHIMPGHGGLLDRLDSLIIVAPMGYYIYFFMEFIFKSI